MRVSSVLLIAFFLISLGADACAYSSTSDCDRWDVARLASVGIRFGSYSHRLQTENPSREWIYIEFDCSDLPPDWEVLLTFKLRTIAGTAADVRAERSKDSPNKLVLKLTLSDDMITHSQIVIDVWGPTADGGRQQHGYKLSCKRIFQLVRDRQAFAQQSRDREHSSALEASNLGVSKIENQSRRPEDR